MYRNIRSTITRNYFDNYAEKIWVYLKKTNTKTSNYDPYRNTGYTNTNQSPHPIKAVVKQRVPTSLQKEEIGLITNGAITLIIKKSDVNAIKFAQKIKYNNEDYTPYSKALGNRVQIERIRFGFYRVVLFRKGNDSKKNQY